MKGIRWGTWAVLVDNRTPHEKGKLGKMEFNGVMRLKARMLSEKYPTSGIKKCGKDRQLLIRTEVQLINGDFQRMKILVDTGAEANLIRQGLLSDHLLYRAQKPLKFETANGQILPGGDRCTKIKMRLRQQGPGGNTEGVDYEVEFMRQA